MTVLVLMPIATKRGGAEQLLQRLLRCEAVPDVRWVVVFLEEGPLRRAFDRDGIETRVVEAGRLREGHRYVWAVNRIATLAGAVGADLMFSWMPKAHFYGGVAAAWADCPAVWYQHGAPKLDWGDQLLTMLPARSVLCCSRHVAGMQADLWPRRDIRVVHPCVDRSRFDPDSLPSPEDARKELGLPMKGPLVGTVGRLQRWKGIHTFVDALPRVLDSHPDARGVIVGGRHSLEPEYDAHIDHRIADRGLQNHIFKVGFQSNVPMWMQAMDVVVHASNAEPFGMVIIEAMALGKPIVAGAGGGPREIITEGEDGLTAPFEQHEALARQLVYLLDHPGEARRMGKAARDRAAEFSALEFADQLTSTLRSLVSSPSA